MGVSFDTEEENRAFAEKYDFPFPLLCDTERQLGLACGACDDPTSKNARRITVLVGPEGRVARVYDQIKAAEHPAQVLQDLTG